MFEEVAFASIANDRVKDFHQNELYVKFPAKRLYAYQYISLRSRENDQVWHGKFSNGAPNIHHEGLPIDRLQKRNDKTTELSKEYHSWYKCPVNRCIGKFAKQD